MRTRMIVDGERALQDIRAQLGRLRARAAEIALAGPDPGAAAYLEAPFEDLLRALGEGALHLPDGAGARLAELLCSLRQFLDHPSADGARTLSRCAASCLVEISSRQETLASFRWRLPVHTHRGKC